MGVEHWRVDELLDEVRKSAGKGLAAGASFLAGRVKELLSTPAPRARVLGRTGVRYYRATTPATAGAPPRKISGRLRSGQTYEVSNDGTRARVGSNVVYARRLEKEGHPYLSVALQRWLNELGTIIGTTMAG